ncbi:GntR family transcriptional regulator [Ottowia sp. VDI28]|uniref:GntR family transcriptional regulator n=1 Tax=Ottowia sp. VDI28 TaxID=3133968 RepID=UPI003C2CAC3B
MPRTAATASTAAAPARSRSTPKFVVGATTLYAQLASVLRSRIIDGEWAPDSDIPSIEELCAQYGLGRITVRQALQILAAEGMVSSQRGRRTFVTYVPQQIEESPLFASLAAVDAQAPDYTIRVISRQRVAELPSTRWDVGQSVGPYMYLRKVDCTGEKPYACSGVYIPADIYKRFPKEAESLFKLVRLVVKYSASKVTLARERVRVAAADFAEAEALGCNMASPVARVERVFCDEDGRVVYLGNSTYLGDLYSMERKLDEYLEGM